jgi:transglutaminase superfamily protein
VVGARLLKFISLPAADRWLLITAIIALIKARLMVTFVPVRKILQPVTPRTEAAYPDIDVARIGWAVEAASRIVPTAKNCLVRAIAGRAMLARCGVRSQIQLGIGKNSPDTLSGHAWLECGEMIITGAGEHRNFAAMPLGECDRESVGG